MNKIFQIGFNRCGTTSIFNFFKYYCVNNLKCIHWDHGKIAKTMFRNIKNKQPPLYNSDYVKYNFISDMEASIDNEVYYFAFLYNYKLLDQYYPNSKFILNTRTKENWINSRLRHYNSKDIELQKKTYQSTNIVDLWSHQWDQHHKDVIDYFNNREKDLLIFNIETNNADPIIAFFPELSFATRVFPKKDYRYKIL
jgi:hypothetical protein